MVSELEDLLFLYDWLYLLQFSGLFYNCLYPILFLYIRLNNNLTPIHPIIKHLSIIPNLLQFPIFSHIGRNFPLPAPIALINFLQIHKYLLIRKQIFIQLIIIIFIVIIIIL